MDADDRTMLKSNIQNVFDNQQDLHKIYKKQTSIIDSTVNIFKKTTDDVNKQFTAMDNEI